MALMSTCLLVRDTLTASNVSSFLYPVPASPPADGIQHTCTFGDDWLAIILDRVDDLQSGEWFDSAPDDIKQQIRELLDLLETDTTPTPQLFPTSAELSGALRYVAVGSDIQFNLSTGQEYGTTWVQLPAAIHDVTIIYVWLRAGDYTIKLTGLKSNASGIVSVVHNGQILGQIDFYAAATALNFSAEVSYNQPLDGQTEFTFQMDSKNASSGNYRLYLSSIRIQLT